MGAGALLLLGCLVVAVSIAVARTGSEGSLGPVDAPLPRDGPFRYADRDPDPSQQTALEFGDRSHWLQPLRAYADTPPAAALRSAIGVSLDVGPGQLDRTARLLAANGFARARLEVSWNRMDFARPDRLRDPAALRAALESLRRHGLRPLILLNANHGEPVPVRRRRCGPSPTLRPGRGRSASPPRPQAPSSPASRASTRATTSRRPPS